MDIGVRVLDELFMFVKFLSLIRFVIKRKIEL